MWEIVYVFDHCLLADDDLPPWVPQVGELRARQELLGSQAPYLGGERGGVAMGLWIGEIVKVQSWFLHIVFRLLYSLGSPPPAARRPYPAGSSPGVAF